MHCLGRMLVHMACFTRSCVRDSGTPPVSELLLLLLCIVSTVQAAICPAFVSRPEGRKFLSCLLTVHPSMVQEMTSVIRNQVRITVLTTFWWFGLALKGVKVVGVWINGNSASSTMRSPWAPADGACVRMFRAHSCAPVLTCT